ncbi:MAG: Rnf-Nqr domain containing protein [Bacilli bacterium]
MTFLITLVSTMIINNIILAGYKGLCSYFGISSNMSSAVGMGLAMTVVSFLSGLICWGLHFATIALDITYLNTVLFILVVASLVQIMEIVLKKFVPSLYKALGIYLPLITTNCAVLGLALALTAYGAVEWQQVLGTALGMPLGYFLILVIFSAVQDKLKLTTTHRAFKGLAISFITTAFMALAFVGFTGLL